MKAKQLTVKGHSSDIIAVMRDTIVESAKSWRVIAALILGAGFGLIERRHTGSLWGIVFGVIASLYTLFLGPLPWRVLVPLEADGHRARKFARWCIAAIIAFVLFTVLVVFYAWVARDIGLEAGYVKSYPRELIVSMLLFFIGSWGIARDVQLEQRLDRTISAQGQLTAELEEARLYALRADLDPHFLFNALNAIASQCVSDPLKAEENIVRLSSLLRAVLDTRRQPLHSLDDEITLANDYLGLLSARYPSISYRIDVDQHVRKLRVPPLLLQPLLENAVRHGKVDQGMITITAKFHDDTLTIQVRSPGTFTGKRDGGMGLELVERRASLAWGKNATFHIASMDNDTVATLTAVIKASQTMTMAMTRTNRGSYDNQ